MSPNSQQHLEPIFLLIEPVVEASGHRLYDIQHNGGTLAVLVQSENDLGVDELSLLSRSVSVVLDEHDPIPGRYTLEISTAGVERRLHQVGHFAGAIGEIVSIRTTPAVDGRRRIVGSLVSVEDGLLTVQDSESGIVTIPLDEIEKARTVFEWGPTPKPGSQPGKKEPAHKHEGGSQK
jgi:ribosome maturation factor RimP